MNVNFEKICNASKRLHTYQMNVKREMKIAQEGNF